MDSDASTLCSRILFAAIVAGLLVRVVISFFVVGSNDVNTWRRFAAEVHDFGFAGAYASDDELNHPPLAALYSRFALGRAWVFGDSWFPFFLKVPAIAGDAASCWLLYRIGRARLNPRAGLCLAAAMAWSIDAILVSGYHGNTDNLCAMLSLGAVYCFVEQSAPLAAGLCLATALNVKLVPVVAFFPLIALCRRWKDLGQFLGGLMIGAIPYLIAFAIVGRPFIRNVFGYNSVPARWGLMYPLTELREHFILVRPANATIYFFRKVGPSLVLALAALAAFWLRPLSRNRQAAYGYVAASYAVMLVFASGFGVQYTVSIVPLLFAYNFRLGLLYSTVAGIFIGCMYFAYWTGTRRYFSDFKGSFPHWASLPGVAVWILLAWFLVDLFLQNRRIQRCLATANGRYSSGEPVVPSPADRSAQRML